MTKRSGGRDSRQDSISDTEEAAENFRVDRVYVPGGTSPPLRQSQPAISTGTAQLMRQRKQGATVSPNAAVETEGELALRRQLSRLQRQLADAQRELANKDEELAAEVEKRADAIDAHDALLEQIELDKQTMEELLAYRARTTGVEQRLQEAVATADELAHVLDLERGKVTAATTRADELQAHFDDARSKWTAERLKLEEQRASETAALEQAKRTAIEQAEATLQSSTKLLRDAHDREVGELRASHERAVSTLRGELEPRAAEARGLAAERERLSNELAQHKAETERTRTAAMEAHAREVTNLTEQHQFDQNALTAKHGAELTHVTSDRDEKAAALDQAIRNQELREQYWESTTNTLREAQKKLQREISEANEKISALESDKSSVDKQLAAASASNAAFAENVRDLQAKLEATEAEARRNALDRQRFTAYLEEGLALVGAIPPEGAPETPDK
ncbi:MAG: hypothetical protein QM831_20405 [Kofleriaceae bacterium]